MHISTNASPGVNIQICVETATRSGAQEKNVQTREQQDRTTCDYVGITYSTYVGRGIVEHKNNKNSL